MAVESVTDFDNAMDCVAWALETGLWNGHVINPERLNDFKDELIVNIAEKFLTLDPESFAFRKIALEFVYIGCWKSNREECEEEFAALQALQNGTAIPVGFRKSIKEFWKKHKVELLLGIAVAAVVTAVAVGILCTAATAGTLAATAEKEKKSPSQASPFRCEERRSIRFSSKGSHRDTCRNSSAAANKS